MKTLLVADDSPTIQKVVALTFSTEDMLIESAMDGEQAIDRVRTLMPDLVLADIFMPGRSGYEVCSTIKSNPELAHIPVVLLVGSLEPFDEEEASRVECDAYLTKPFDTTELVNIVHSLLSEERKPRIPAVQQVEAAAAVSSRTRESFLASDSILDLFGTRSQPVAVADPVVAAPAPVVQESAPSVSGHDLSEQTLDAIVQQVVRRISTDVVREIAWEIVPEVSEMVVRQYLEEKGLPPAQKP